MSPNEHKPISEAEKIEMRDRVNARIAHWCSFAALVIILIDFAAFVIGQDDWFWTVAGIMLSIALLAIAMLNNPIGSNSKKIATANHLSGEFEQANLAAFVMMNQSCHSWAAAPRFLRCA